MFLAKLFELWTKLAKVKSVFPSIPFKTIQKYKKSKTNLTEILAQRNLGMFNRRWPSETGA